MIRGLAMGGEGQHFHGTSPRRNYDSRVPDASGNYNSRVPDVSGNYNSQFPEASGNYDLRCHDAPGNLVFLGIIAGFH